MSTGEKNIRTLDFWRWRQRDGADGATGWTLFGLIRDPSGAFPEARRLTSEKAAEERERPDFEDTTPLIGRLEPE